MIILAIFAAAVVVGVWMANTFQWDWRELAGMLISASGGVGLFMALLAFPIERLGTRGQIVEFHSVRATLGAARARGESNIENAAFQVKVAEANQWLASKQYWNGTVFDIWIPDAVDSLRPIR